MVVFYYFYAIIPDTNRFFFVQLYLLARPCQRCIKRGLETTCTDGIRKRAKYLQDDESGKKKD